MSDPKNNLQTIRDLYAAFAEGNIPAVLETLSPDIEWHEPDGFPYPGTFRGPEDVLNKLFARLAEDWEGWAARPDEFVDGGEVIAVFGEYSGAYRSTRKQMRSPFAHYWRFERGKAREFRTYMDTVLVQRALDGSGDKDGG